MFPFIYFSDHKHAVFSVSLDFSSNMRRGAYRVRRKADQSQMMLQIIWN